MPVKAAPMMMPTAKSTTLPRMMKAWKSPIQPGLRNTTCFMVDLPPKAMQRTMRYPVACGKMTVGGTVWHPGRNAER